ncbi:butyrophilin subfamily 1 member A1-like isoform X1 [Pelodiscus sinensis]|uniref:butyrophilin subfamily 1 member A1-like isoform X1 n=1 Tax=Pelodiscus sinensis TaxID=13735 RepID=UPI003F6C3C68
MNVSRSEASVFPEPRLSEITVTVTFCCCFLSSLPPSGLSQGEMKILSVYDSSRARSSLPHFIVFFLTYYVHRLESAQFAVNGPAHPVTAVVGEGIKLPCSLSPGMNAEHMEVRWFRREFTPFVHLYQCGKDEFGQQMPEYHGRTELLKDSITDGNVELGIINVRPSDEGQYHCSVQDGDFQEEAVLELKVAALGSAPHISVEGHQDGGIRVVCQSAGWYPQPQVLWRDPKGQPLSASTETKSEEDGDFFKTKNSIVIMENSHKSLSCSMRNTHLDEERKSITFYISDSFFPRASPWMVGWNVTLVILLPFVCLASFLFRVRGKHLDTISKICTELEWRRALHDAANVTLDPDTAHPQLILSEDGKRVRQVRTRQPPPDIPERFDYWCCVLGLEGFTSGRHYWEVEVGGGLWAVGVARESVSRKGEISLSPKGGIWAVGQWGDEFEALTDPHTALLLSPPSRIRVCLDCDRGQVTFIDAGTEASIFTFPPGSLPGERIRPWVWVWGTKTLQLFP